MLLAEGGGDGVDDVAEHLLEAGQVVGDGSELAVQHRALHPVAGAWPGGVEVVQVVDVEQLDSVKGGSDSPTLLPSLAALVMASISITSPNCSATMKLTAALRRQRVR